MPILDSIEAISKTAQNLLEQLNESNKQNSIDESQGDLEVSLNT